ncbi:MAG: hypothetical protein ACFE96_18740, partial [Candidatus Hermodarchaeota archaeon]
MDRRERNILIAITSILIGSIIIIYSIPNLFMYSRYRLELAFLNPYFYLLLHLLFLAIGMFFYAYFLLRPVKTLKSRKILSKVVLSFGVFLLIFPHIGIGLMLTSIPY